MAIKKLLNFAIRILGDGASASFTVTVASAPLGVGTPQAAGSAGISATFSLVSTIPSDVASVKSSMGHAISASILAGVITFTYAVNDIPADNEEDTVYGYLVF